MGLAHWRWLSSSKGESEKLEWLLEGFLAVRSSREDHRTTASEQDPQNRARFQGISHVLPSGSSLGGMGNATPVFMVSEERSKWEQHF